MKKIKLSVNVWNQDVKNNIVNVLLLVRHVILIVLVLDVIIQNVIIKQEDYKLKDVIVKKLVVLKNIVNVI